MDDAHSTARMRRERRTIAAMIAAYCRGVHGRARQPCSECGELRAYAEQRLDGCPYGADKPVCAQCPIHCYQPKRREQVKAVMRWAGPRVSLRHPYLALRHWLDGWKRVPPRPRRGIQRAARVEAARSHAAGSDQLR